MAPVVVAGRHGRVVVVVQRRTSIGRRRRRLGWLVAHAPPGEREATASVGGEDAGVSDRVCTRGRHERAQAQQAVKEWKPKLAANR